MNRGGRKRRRKFCLPSCFSAPSVWDPEELEFKQDGLQIDYLSRLRSLSRTVPVEEIAGDGGEGYLEVRSPAGNQSKGLGQIFPRKEINTEAGAQNSTRTPPSTRAHIQQSVFCHVSTKFNSRSQPLTPPRHARTPVQSAYRTSKPATPQPNRPTGPAPPPGRSAHRFDVMTGLLMVAATLAVMLSFGRLCAVLCNCAWFYLLSRVQPAPSAAAPPPEMAEEVDLDSPEYKKKVVLMGLLERNRYGAPGTPVRPLASPATARYINC